MLVGQIRILLNPDQTSCSGIVTNHYIY